MEDGNHPKRTTTVPAPKRPSVDATAITVTPANRRRVSHVGTNNFVIGFNLDDTFFVLLIPRLGLVIGIAPGSRTINSDEDDELVPLLPRLSCFVGGFVAFCSSSSKSDDDDDESEDAAENLVSTEAVAGVVTESADEDVDVDDTTRINLQIGGDDGWILRVSVVSDTVDGRGWEYSEKGSYDGDGRLRQRVQMRLLVPCTFSLVPSETVRGGIGTAGVLIVVDGDVKSYGSGDEGEVDPGESKDSKAPANYTFPFTLDCTSK
ncbi:hypothetical protein JOM56_005276 [Amanita muscaria]